MSAIDIFLYFLDGLNPTITAAFISTFNSAIAVGGSLVGAMLGSTITLYFTGHNQRKHLEKEAALKEKRELGEQKRLFLLDLMESWNEAFLRSGDFLNLVIRYRVQNSIPPEQSLASQFQADHRHLAMLEKMTSISGELRHQLCKFMLFYGETELYTEVRKFHIHFDWYAIHISQYSEKEQADERERLKGMRDELIKRFWVLLQNPPSPQAP